MCIVAIPRRLFCRRLFSPSLVSRHSRSPSGGVGSRNKRNEDQAGGEGSGLDVRLQQRVRLKSREVLLALWSFSSFPSCLAY